MPGRLKNRTTWPRRDCASHGATTNWYLSLQPPPNWGLTTQNWDIIDKRCRIHLYRHVLSSVIPLGYSPFLVELSLMETDILHSPTSKEDKSKSLWAAAHIGWDWRHWVWLQLWWTSEDSKLDSVPPADLGALLDAMPALGEGHGRSLKDRKLRILQQRLMFLREISTVDPKSSGGRL